MTNSDLIDNLIYSVIYCLILVLRIVKGELCFYQEMIETLFKTVETISSSSENPFGFGRWFGRIVVCSLFLC